MTLGVIKTVLALLFFHLSGLYISAQKLPFTEVGYPSSQGKDYFLDIDSIELSIRSNIADLEEKNPEFSEEYNRFAKSSARQLERLVSGNSIYSDWQEMETYLNAVFAEIFPELNYPERPRIYLIKSPHYNAFMTGSGQMFIHVGLIAQMENEAELASVICHEFAHNMHRHSLQSYLEYSLGAFTKKQVAWKPVKVKTQELEADKTGFDWLQESNYSVDGSLLAFRYFERLEKQRERRFGSKIKFTSANHPTSIERLEQLNKLYQNDKKPNRKRFIIADQSTFEKFKRIAQAEKLRLHLTNKEYNDCIEAAFKYHVISTAEHSNVYYLIEAIRRKCLLQPYHYHTNFITSGFYKPIVSGTSTDERVTEHLFEKMDNDCLGWSSTEMKSITAGFYWQDQPKFTTYLEALQFFMLVGEKLECQECYLPIALAYEIGSEQYEGFLAQYLSKPNSIAYRDLAEGLVSNEVLRFENPKKLFVVQDPRFTWKVGGDNYRAFVDYKNETVFDDLVHQLDDSIADFEVVQLSRLMHEDYRKYELISDVADLVWSSKRQTTGLDSLNPFILDPRFYNIFKELQVDDISFVYTFVAEFKKLKDVEDRSTLSEQASLKELLATDDRLRYLDIFVVGFGVIEDEWRHGLAYEFDIKIDNGTTTADKLVSHSKVMLKRKEWKAKYPRKNMEPRGRKKKLACFGVVGNHVAIPFPHFVSHHLLGLLSAVEGRGFSIHFASRHAVLTLYASIGIVILPFAIW